MFINNLFLSFNSTCEIEEGIKLYLLSLKQQNDLNNDLIEVFNTHKVPKIAIIILISCWICNRNPEATDKKIFKDIKGSYKGSKKDNKV